MAMPDFPIPGIHFFMSGNSFTGSHCGLNYRIDPVWEKEEEDTESHFSVQIWYGMLCSACSEMQASASFALDTDGLAAAVNWLVEQDRQYREREI